MQWKRSDHLWEYLDMIGLFYLKGNSCQPRAKNNNMCDNISHTFRRNITLGKHTNCNNSSPAWLYLSPIFVFDLCAIWGRLIA